MNLHIWVIFCSILGSDIAGTHSALLLHWKAPQHNIDLRFHLMIIVLRTRETEARKPLSFHDCMNCLYTGMLVQYEYFVRIWICMRKSACLFQGTFARQDNENYITIDQSRTKEHSTRAALCCETDASSFIDSLCVFPLFLNAQWSFT